MESISEHDQEQQNPATAIPETDSRNPCEECGGSMAGLRKNAKTCSKLCANNRNTRLKKERKAERIEKSYLRYKEEFEEYIKHHETFLRDCRDVISHKRLLRPDQLVRFTLAWEETIWKHKAIGLSNGCRKIANEMVEERWPETKEMINHKKRYGG